MGKSRFFLKSLQKYAAMQNANCPYCGERQTQRLQRKKLFLQLRRCNACRLMFRYPKDDATENKGFYQRNYQQETVTELPKQRELPDHIATKFATVGRDLTEHLTEIRKIDPNTHRRVLDYGC